MNLLEDISKLPNAKYFALLIKEQLPFEQQPIRELFNWLLTGDEKYINSLVKTCIHNYTGDAKLFVEEFICKYVTSDVLKLLDPYILEYIAKYPDIDSIRSKAKLILALDTIFGKFNHCLSDPWDVYLAKFLVTGENPVPKDMYEEFYQTFVIMPEELKKFIMDEFEMYDETYAANQLLNVLSAIDFELYAKYRVMPKADHLRYVLHALGELGDSAKFIENYFYPVPEAPEVPSIVI